MADVSDVFGALRAAHELAAIDEQLARGVVRMVARMPDHFPADA